MAPENAEALAGVRPGEILAGKYRVERVLGVGGMGVVVAARHVELDHRVAIKFLLPALVENTEAAMRFSREARAAVRIESEHVARVLDIGTLENGAPFMVMEFLEGGDLAAYLRQHGPLPIALAVDFVLQACVAVAEAHRLGIVHRDLKPANLFCTTRNDGQPIIKVLDFGISKVVGPGAGSGMSMTRTSVAMGSPYYMSPEQVQSARDVDTRTDIWALGIILFELMTGKPPFQAEAFGEMAVKISVEEPAAFRYYRSDVSPELEGVVRRCLAKKRDHRYANVAELAFALAPFAPARGQAAIERISGILQVPLFSSYPPPGFNPTTTSPPETVEIPAAPLVPGTIASWAETQQPSGRKKAITAGAVLVAGLALLAGAGVVARNALAPEPQAQSVPDAEPTLAPTDPTPPATPELRITTIAPEAPPVAVEPPPAPSVHEGHEGHESVPQQQHFGRHDPAPSPGPGPGRDTSKPPTPQPPPAPAPEPIKKVEEPPKHEATAPPPAKSECDPPYTRDEQGRKIFKPACFLAPKP